MLSSLAPEIKTNRLNVYLLKENIKKTEDALKNSGLGLLNISFEESGTLFYSSSDVYYPEWLKTFFLEDNRLDKNDFKMSLAKAILLVSVVYNRKRRLFAIPFGSGRFLLADNAIEERFGLKTTLNMLEVSGIKSIGKKTLSENPKLSIQQISKETEASDFEIDIERDIVNSISGRSTNSSFGKLLTGKDALHVSSKVDIKNIGEFLKECLKYYYSDNYKTRFEWIDYIKEIKNKTLIQTLDTNTIKLIKAESKHVWMSIPDIMEWSDFSGFKYSKKRGDDYYQDLDIKDYIKEIGGMSEVTVDNIRDDSVTAWNSTEEKIVKSWSVYKCLNVEANLKGQSYLLDGGKWYEINNDFVKEVENSIKAIPKSSLKLIDYTHTSEEAYNKALAIHLGGYCADKSLISHGKGHSKIEFCDVLTQTKNLLFVKRYTASSSMSHLFSQGFVTGELLRFDKLFRNAIASILPKKYSKVIPDSKNEIVPKQYTLTYVVIAKKSDQQLPFFSKVNLRNYFIRLKSYGYNVEISNVLNK